MKVWLDDIRPAPVGYVWLRSVNAAKAWILQCERKYADLFTKERKYDTNLLARYWDIDHDAGEFVRDGGDYIELLKWLEETHRLNFTFKLHSANPVGVENMRRIIERNGWTEVK
jgi:hypothetical protein